MTAAQLLRNAVRCMVCGDVIESVYFGEWARCSCGNAYVGGGLDVHIHGSADGFVEDLCEYTP